MGPSVKVLGAFEVRDGSGGIASLRTRKTQAILGYLAVNADKLQPREWLMSLAWSDRSEPQARQSLNDALKSIRRVGREAGIEILKSDSQQVTLLSEAMTIDVVRFRALLQDDPAGAAKLYHGPLLDGFSIPDPAFEEWLTSVRAEHHALASDAFARASDAFEAAGELDPAIDHARSLIELEPLNEEAQRRLMRLLDRAGERSKALLQYQTFQQTLKKELQTEPHAETAALFEEIRGSAQQGSALAGSHEGGNKPRLFVEPFAVTGGAEEEALAKGIAEQLAEVLPSMRNFLVVTRPEDANYLLRSSLRASGHRRRLQAHLIYSPEQDRFWSRHFDFDDGDVFEAQDFFAHELFRTVRGAINDSDGRRVSRKDVTQMTVDELLSLSAHKFMQNDVQVWREVPAIMDRALAKDPDNPAALARWALATLAEYSYGYRKIASERQQEAKARANRAQQLDPLSAFVHLVRANLSLYFDAAYEDAIITANRALAINPQSDLVRNIKCQAMIFAGRCREGIEQMLTVAELNPDSAYLSSYLVTHALGNFGLADYDAAAILYRQAERASPNLPIALMGRITSLWHNGDRKEAEETARRFLADHPEFRLVEAHLPPWRDQETMLRYVEGLRETGLPE